MLPFIILAVLILFNTKKSDSTVLTTVEGLFLKSIKNNNPGNLRPLPNGELWEGQIGISEDGYCVFKTPYHGTRATAINALNYNLKHNITTLQAFGDRWASNSVDGNTLEYGKSLAQYLDVSPTANFDFENRLPELVEAITHNEGGFLAVTYFKDNFQVASAEALTRIV